MEAGFYDVLASRISTPWGCQIDAFIFSVIMYPLLFDSLVSCIVTPADKSLFHLAKPVLPVPTDASTNGQPVRKSVECLIPGSDIMVVMEVWAV